MQTRGTKGSTVPTDERRQPPGDRLLKTATALFDREGIRAVGIERLIAEAGVARASLYQTFGSKDALAVAYLERADLADRAKYQHAVRTLSEDPTARVAAFFKLATTSMKHRHFRGWLFVNAATEFPEASHPVHEPIAAHRAWQRLELIRAAEQVGATDAERVGTRLQVLYDGALVSSRAVGDTKPITEAAVLSAALLGLASPDAAVEVKARGTLVS